MKNLKYGDNYFAWWVDSTEEEKYSEWTDFATETGSSMTYPAFCNQIDEWSKTYA